MAKTKRMFSDVDPVVFATALSLIVIFCIVGGLWPDLLSKYAGTGLHWLVAKLSWVFVLTSTGFVLFALALAGSRYGRIPLSEDGEEPEYSFVSWAAMMFSAGMGIGLVFFGVYEPVAHMANPAPWLAVEPGTEQAARLAMGYTLFHWGLQPWAIYGVVALALAYSTFRRGRGNLISAPFQPLAGEKAVDTTWWGKAIDIWAVIATKFGGATSLGLGALQIAAGLSLLTGLDSGSGQSGGVNYVAFVVIIVLVAVAVVSAVSGVSRGIKWLSNTNMAIAALLMLFILVVGPTAFILGLIPATFGAYLYNLVQWSFRGTAFGGVEWMSSWTIFYWAWWISWAPFVGTFIARVSRGRTIREFVLVVLFVPTVVSALWFIVFGGMGIHLQLQGIANIADAPSNAVAFFHALREYPLYIISGPVVIFLVAIFWISGADANALVLGMLSSHGTTEPNKWIVALWAVLAAAVAIVLLFVGGLGALQTFTILVAAPFVLVMCGLCVALYVDLRHDSLRAEKRDPVGENDPEADEEVVTGASTEEAEA